MGRSDKKDVRRQASKTRGLQNLRADPPAKSYESEDQTTFSSCCRERRHNHRGEQQDPCEQRNTPAPLAVVLCTEKIDRFFKLKFDRKALNLKHTGSH